MKRTRVLQLLLLVALYGYLIGVSFYDGGLQVGWTMTVLIVGAGYLGILIREALV